MLTDDIAYDIIKSVGRAEDILQRMRRNPRDRRIESLEAVARRLGMLVRRPGSGSSHVIFGHPSVEEIVSVPARRPLKPVYLRRFLKPVERIEEARARRE